MSGLPWRSVFFLNVPIGGAAGLALAARVLRGSAPRPHGVDPTGQLAGIAALGGLTLALIETGSAEWASPVVIGGTGSPFNRSDGQVTPGPTPQRAGFDLRDPAKAETPFGGFAAFVVAGGAFVLVERRVSAPMLPLGLFSSATFFAATVVGLLINLGFYGELFVMSLYLQTLRGFTPLLAGIALVPEAAMAIVGSTASGRAMARTGPCLPTLCGFCVGGTGLLGLIAVRAHTSYDVLVVPFMAAGLGRPGGPLERA